MRGRHWQVEGHMFDHSTVNGFMRSVAIDTVCLNLSCSWQLHEAFIISFWQMRLGVSGSQVGVEKLDFAVMVYNNMPQITVSFKWQRFIFSSYIVMRSSRVFRRIWILPHLDPSQEQWIYSPCGWRQKRKCAKSEIKYCDCCRPHVNCKVIQWHHLLLISPDKLDYHSLKASMQLWEHLNCIYENIISL